MFRLTAVLLFISFLSPSSSKLIERCLHLTTSESIRSEIMKACMGKEVHVENFGLSVVKSDPFMEPFVGEFPTFEGKMLISSRVKSMAINKINANLSEPDIVLDAQNSLFLTDLKIHEKLPDDFSVAFVRGNRHLTRKSIEKIKKVFDNSNQKFGHIQEPGECYLGEKYEERELQNFAQSFYSLKGCVYVLGNLTLLQGLKNEGEFPKSLVEVRGCITVVDTELTDVFFLENIVVPEGACGNESKHRIIDNSYLSKIPKSIAQDKKWSVVLKESERSPCLDPLYRNTPFGRLCGYKYNTDYSNHRGYCKWSKDMQNLATLIRRRKVEYGVDCRKITVNVTFHKTYPDEDTDAFSSVEVIEGVLEIINTTLTDIRLFPNLHTVIGVDPTLPTIHITGNQFLKTLEFPSLNYIFSKTPSNVKLIVIKNNGEYGMPVDEYNRLVYIFGEDRLDIDVVNFAGPIPMEKLFLIAAFAVSLIGSIVMWTTEIMDKVVFIRNSTAISFDANELFTMIGPMLPWRVKVRFWLRQRLGLVE